MYRQIFFGLVVLFLMEGLSGCVKLHSVGTDFTFSKGTHNGLAAAAIACRVNNGSDVTQVPASFSIAKQGAWGTSGLFFKTVCDRNLNYVVGNMPPGKYVLRKFNVEGRAENAGIYFKVYPGKMSYIGRIYVDASSSMRHPSMVAGEVPIKYYIVDQRARDVSYLQNQYKNISKEDFRTGLAYLHK